MLNSRVRLGASFAGALVVALGLAAEPAGANDHQPWILLASTTSTENSGLFKHLLPIFEKATSIKVRVVAVGTGQALRLGRNGDVDVLLVHHRASELRFVRQGHGVKRYRVMYNDFVIVGPRADPARVRGMKEAVAALKRIARSRSIFTSRGDDSGTHKKERDLWRASGVALRPSLTKWYRETGAGMGATLNIAAALDGYALTDRATWLAFANKSDLVLLVEGDRRLFNQYGVILVNPARHPRVRKAKGQRFINWLVSRPGQKAIASYRLDGRQLFFPNAAKTGTR